MAQAFAHALGLAFGDGGRHAPSPGEGEPDSASWVLEGHASCVRRARRLVRDQLGLWGLRDRRGVADPLVTELVGEALRLAGGPMRLSLYLVDDTLRAEVEAEDADARPSSGTCPEAEPLGAGRRGGRVASPARGRADVVDRQALERLACCWGRVHTATGVAVWAEFPSVGRPRHAHDTTRR
ncbi:hypothetical protein [Microtetraspora fusca]|uniref:hypothetical protein n=1 Tax=Microtetraspora fusca TaxID=1997 RepID=UPI0012F9462E|nr:hypothetical protein [Microtetraspora fusca]